MALRKVAPVLRIRRPSKHTLGAFIVAALRTYQARRASRSEPRKLVPCDSVYLPEETAHLAVELESAEPRKRKKVWFPVDENGEPHTKNPDDGYGGAKFALSTIHEFPVITEGKTIREACRQERQQPDHEITRNLYSDAIRNLQKEQMNGTREPFYIRETVWRQFDDEYQKIKNPDWQKPGLLWRFLFGSEHRYEEDTCRLSFTPSSPSSTSSSSPCSSLECHCLEV